MKLTRLGTKISLCVIAMIIVLMSATVLIVRLRTDKILTELTMRQARAANHAFSHKIQEMQDDTQEWSRLISDDAAVIAAVEKADHAELLGTLVNFSRSVDFITVCDADGIVLARTHSMQVGDNILSQKLVADTLSTGYGGSTIAKGTEVGVSVRGSATVCDANGELIGVVISGYDLSQPWYVDEFKLQNDSEATFVFGDDRISSTIVDENGVSIVGTKSDPAVVAVVLGSGQDFSGRLNIAGMMFETYYSPLVVDGEAVGMLFTGVNIEPILARQRELMGLIAGVAVLGVAIAGVLVIELSRRLISQPLHEIGMAVQRVKQEDIDAQTYMQTRVQADSKDEIGEFAQIFNGMLDRLSNSTASEDMLQNILNGLEAYIYVSDPEMDTVLFVNERLKAHFQLQGDVIGQSCWKVFQAGRRRRCEFCPNYRLKDAPTVPVEWEEFSTITGRYYKNVDRIIDWPGGKKVHLQHRVDITDSKQSEEALNYRLEQQKLVSAVLRNFNDEDDMEAFAVTALGMAGEFLHVDKVFLSWYQEEAEILDCICEWCDDATLSYGDSERWRFTPDMPVYQELESRGHHGVDPFMEPDFPEIANERERAALYVAIEVSGALWGILGFVVFDEPYHWTDSDIYLGKTIAGIMSGVINRQNMHEQTIEAKNAAERASHAKSDFLSRMSHEMRTPMNAIIGMTGIARGSDDLEKKDYCLERIDSASKHLLGVINDILDMSKIESGKFELVDAEFSFEKMLMHAVGVVNFRVAEKNQELIINPDKDIPTYLVGDEQRLSQVVTNLLTNAIKFTPEGGKIILNAKLVDKADGSCTIRTEVVDNGIGISEDQQARLFSPFEQANDGIAAKYGGTGLGLAISKQIVELMGGEIWVESEPDHGAKFGFTVQVRPGSGRYKSSLAVDKDSVHILAVDDAPEIRVYFREFMDTLGLSCDVAEGGPQALELVKERNYNIFFVDWRMPDMNGIELTRRLKEITSNNAIVIMISAAQWSDIEHDAVEAGVSRFIAKPLFPSDLIDAMNECMSVVAVAAEAPAAMAPHFANGSLLLVEDVEINREIVEAMLADTGLVIETAENGLEALELVQADPTRYALILMDIQMPVMDGYAATRAIRAMGGYAAQVPIIAMTANVFREDVERCLAAGMNDHIGKPMDEEALFEKLKQYLKTAGEK